MSNDTKFLRNRFNLLFGKPKINKPMQEVSFKVQAGPSLFRDYTYVQMRKQSGVESYSYPFVCFTDTTVFGQTLAIVEQRYDNDEDSKVEQIRKDISQGINYLNEGISKTKQNRKFQNIKKALF